jgi:undecaprenyl-diphosphatase
MDTWLFQLINRGMANPLFDVLMPALTHQGYLLIIPLALYALYAGARTPASPGGTCLAAAITTIVIAALAVPLAEALGNWLKMLIARPRPCQGLESVRLLVRCPASFSMPSGHAITSFAGAVPFFILARPFLAFGWRITPLVIAGMVAFSRPYLGVHYPSDIVAGAVLGAMVSGGMCWGYLKFRQKTDR